MDDTKLSSSPSEDFNPLQDETTPANNGDLSPDEQSPDSPSSSLELPSGSFHKYGVTPPSNFREEKRKKNKQRSSKQKTEKREINHQVKNFLLDMANQEQLENVMELEESGPSTVRAARSKHRRENSKNLKTSRGQDRDVKQNTEAVSQGVHTCPNPLMVMVECPVKVDTSNRFFTLNSRQVTASQQTQYAALIKPAVLPHRKQSVSEQVECPRNREEFYKIFSTLIKMGNSNREKEKSGSSGRAGPSLVFSRQQSLEQPSWMIKYSDMLWLELQAWQRSRSIQQQSSYISRAQQKVPSILQEVIDFQVKLSDEVKSEKTSDAAKSDVGKSDSNCVENASHTTKMDVQCTTHDAPEHHQGSDNVSHETASSHQAEPLCLPSKDQNSDLAEICDMVSCKLTVTQPNCDTNIVTGSVDSVPLVTVTQPANGDSTTSEDPHISCDSCTKIKDLPDHQHSPHVVPCGHSSCIIHNRSLLDSQNSSYCSEYSIYNPSLFKVIEQQKEALVQVCELLKKLETVENVYQNRAALARDWPLYADPMFQRRLNTLCSWLNITKDIGQKLQQMAKILYLDEMPDFPWPWLDADTFSIGQEAFEAVSETETETDSDTEEYDMAPDSGIPTSASDSNHYVHFTGGRSPVDSSPEQTRYNPMDSSTPHKIASAISRTGSCINIEDMSSTTIYRYFADRMLKKTGLRKLRVRMEEILVPTLMRARSALEATRQAPSYADVVGDRDKPLDLSVRHSSSFMQVNSDMSAPDIDAAELMDFSELKLPSFLPTYLFLVRVPLDVIHECLRLRLQQRPEKDPSILSVRQLIYECKEVLQAAVMMKQFYQKMVGAVTPEEEHHDRFEVDLEVFEEDMKEMLDVYFKYVQTWMFELQNLPEMSKRLKNALEDEWNFTKLVCPHVRGGEANAGNQFCLMGSSLLNSISDYLETGMDECIDLLYDSTTTMNLEDPAEDSELQRSPNVSVELRQAIIRTSRNFKDLFHEARERASKSLGFAKMLRNDLEIAADYNVTVTAEELLKKLEDTSHIRVVAPHSSGYLMFVPQHLRHDQSQILQLLNVTCGREDPSKATSVEPPSSGYLLLIKCEGCADMQRTCPRWTGATVMVEPTADTTIALSHIEVEGLLLVVIHSSHLSSQRQEFEQLLASEVQLVNENTSCHQAISESLAELKMAAIDLREKIAYAIKQVDEKLNLDDIPEMDSTEKDNIQKLYRETLHQCYNFGFEYHKEVIRLVSGEQRVKLNYSLVGFAKQWMKFVADKCERGRGLRPRWANHGLDFLPTACEPRVLATLTEEEFEELKKCINECICHVIGEKVTPTSPCNSGFRSPDISSSRHALLRNVSCPDTTRVSRNRSPSTRSQGSQGSESPSPGVHHSRSETGLRMSSPSSRRFSSTTSPFGSSGSQHDNCDGGFQVDVSPNSKSDREVAVRHEEEEEEEDESDSNSRSRMLHVYANIKRLEAMRNKKLYDERAIGRATHSRVTANYHINVRRVNFKWQRGIKIGEGNFGKVYTAVNINTGELMAMKEVRFQPNDHQTIKHIADEIKNVEGISHKMLVKYHGVELHRDEMLIFMEYCSSGTIAEVAQLGLSEAMVRKYTHDILVGINVLHDHGIIHRDIKGQNIFLTEDGLKLGDFGSSVKLKSYMTMPGELKGMEGTTPYMAPEVITQSSPDHGRAADIWSLGCVVIEMATGKRPWHELETHVMIMFKVGSGAAPQIPESLSEEGQDFLSYCLQHDPRKRATASELLEHAFVKTYSEDETE